MSTTKPRFDRVEAMSNDVAFNNTFAPYSNKVFAKLLAVKKVTRCDVTLAHVQYVMQTIDAINSLDRYASELNGRQFDKIYLAKWMKPFLFPRRVHAEATYKAKNILNKPAMPKDYEFNEGKLREILSEMAAALKHELKVSEMDRLSDCLSDEIKVFAPNESAFGNRMRDGDGYIIPMPIKDEVRTMLYEETDFKADAGEIIKYYILEKLDFLA